MNNHRPQSWPNLSAGATHQSSMSLRSLFTRITFLSLISLESNWSRLSRLTSRSWQTRFTSLNNKLLDYQIEHQLIHNHTIPGGPLGPGSPAFPVDPTGPGGPGCPTSPDMPVSPFSPLSKLKIIHLEQFSPKCTWWSGFSLWTWQTIESGFSWRSRQTLQFKV